MYQRRKLLLALIEDFGGHLNQQNCQMLMFLVCQQQNNSEYNFLPAEYGPHSHILDHDKDYLTKKGYLAESADFVIKDLQGIQLDLFVQVIFQQVRAKINGKRGHDLLRYILKEYPYYGTRCDLAKELLIPDELAQVETLRPADETPCWFSIGYEGISVDRYIDKLLRHNIHALIDVRANPFSRKYGYSKTQLEDFITDAGMQYIHLPELGIPSVMRKDHKGTDDHTELFRYYSEQMLPKQQESLDLLERLTHEYGRVALTCFEAEHQHCHRSRITAYFETQPGFDVPILHI